MLCYKNHPVWLNKGDGVTCRFGTKTLHFTNISVPVPKWLETYGTDTRVVGTFWTQNACTEMFHTKVSGKHNRVAVGQGLMNLKSLG